MTAKSVTPRGYNQRMGAVDMFDNSLTIRTAREMQALVLACHIAERERARGMWTLPPLDDVFEPRGEQP